MVVSLVDSQLIDRLKSCGIFSETLLRSPSIAYIRKSLVAYENGRLKIASSAATTEYALGTFKVHPTEAKVNLVANGQRSLALWCTSGPVTVVSLPSSSALADSFVLPEKRIVDIGKDQIVWVGWHPASLSDEHLLVLTSNGTLRMFNVKSGKAELSLRIRSPEDFSLGCVSAALGGNGLGWSWATLFVLLENGDILTVCPVLPFPFKVNSGFLDALLAAADARIQASETDEDGECLMKERQFVHGLIRESVPMGDLTVVRRPPLGHKELPFTCGPYLVQPEPPFGQVATCMAHLCIDNVELIFIGFDKGSVDICFIEGDVLRPRWRSLGGKEAPLNPLLTAVESLSFVESPSPIGIGVIEHSDKILVTTQSQAFLMSFEWIHEASSPSDISSKIQPVFSSGNATVNKALGWINPLSGNVIVLGCLGQRGVEIKAFESPSRVPTGSLVAKLGTMSMSPKQAYSPESSSFVIKFDKVKLPPELGSQKFPDDLDEKAMEAVIDMIDGLRMNIISKCIAAADQITEKTRALSDALGRQLAWAIQLDQVSASQMDLAARLEDKYRTAVDANQRLEDRLKRAISLVGHSQTNKELCTRFTNDLSTWTAKLGSLQTKVERIKSIWDELQSGCQGPLASKDSLQKLVASQAQLQTDLLERIKSQLSILDGGP